MRNLYVRNEAGFRPVGFEATSSLNADGGSIATDRLTLHVFFQNMHKIPTPSTALFEASQALVSFPSDDDDDNDNNNNNKMETRQAMYV
jgi:hypothetical protein